VTTSHIDFYHIKKLDIDICLDRKLILRESLIIQYRIKRQRGTKISSGDI